jgi:hypothetical protein
MDCGFAVAGDLAEVIPHLFYGVVQIRVPMQGHFGRCG